MKKFDLINVVFYSLLLIGVGINIGQFSYIEDEQSANYTALNVSKTSDAIKVGTSSSPTLRGYYLPWLTLSKIAPGSTIIVPSSSSFNDAGRVDQSGTLGRLRGYGKTSEIIIKDTRPLDVNLLVNKTTGCVVASGENARRDLPYFAIFMDLDKCPKRTTTNQNGLYISKELPSKTNAFFLLIPWEGPSEPFLPSGKVADLDSRKADYYALLIEISLLPEDIQKELVQ